AETAVDICRISMGIHASYGLMRDYKIAQLWDDAIMGPQVEGTAPVLKILAAGILLKDALPN
ncbi:MAG: acyl-CoA dehydrogenase family protein, partial [Bacillota bacterium]|nr:acyl-CoA dehydrogenase family protein [Bacillota bacterium]